jgi:hypothetical protein
MGRIIRTRIEFEFDEDVMNEGLEDGAVIPENTMSDDELLQHAAERFVDDIYQMVKYNELYEVALSRTTFVDEFAEEEAGK